jgi:hypothetical protein
VKYTLFLFFIIGLGSCREPYDPPVRDTNIEFLVVEGTLNTTGATTIKLSRTTNLNRLSTVAQELKAQVSVENEQNQMVGFAEKGKGEYILNFFNLPGSRFRLRIKTNSGRQYLSEYVVPARNSLIKSIGWKRDNAGINLSLNAVGTEQDSRFYRWEYEETWEFKTIKSEYKFVWPSKIQEEGHLERRTGSDILPDVCWATNQSTTIFLGTTKNLSENIVSNEPIARIPLNSWKLSKRYSILVRQYALNQKAFDYWNKVKRNTEQLGSVFDPQPSQINGNLYSLADGKEQVIGYFDICNVREERIFIDNSDVPGWQDERQCSVITIPPVDADGLPVGKPWDYFVNGEYIPVGLSSGAKAECVDCRKLGVSVKPVFWN